LPIHQGTCEGFAYKGGPIVDLCVSSSSLTKPFPIKMGFTVEQGFMKGLTKFYDWLST